jgi:hypothetical protein
MIPPHVVTRMDWNQSLSIPLSAGASQGLIAFNGVIAHLILPRWLTAANGATLSSLRS